MKRWRILNFLEALNRTLLTVRVTKQTDERKIGEGQMICVERGIFALRTKLFKALVLRRSPGLSVELYGMESDKSDLLSDKSGQGNARIALPCRKSKPIGNELEPGFQVGLFFNEYNIEGHRINGNRRPF